MLKYRLLGVAFILLSMFAIDNARVSADACPRRHFTGVCIQVITYARNPHTGDCCQYPNPCVVPEGWETFTNPDCTNSSPEPL